MNGSIVNLYLYRANTNRLAGNVISHQMFPPFNSSNMTN